MTVNNMFKTMQKQLIGKMFYSATFLLILRILQANLKKSGILLMSLVH